MKNRHIVAGIAGLTTIIALIAYGISPNEITSALQARGIADHGCANLYETGSPATAYRQFMVRTKDNGRLDASWFDMIQLLSTLPKWGGNYYVDPGQPTPPGDTPPGCGAIFSPYQTMQAAAMYEADVTNGFSAFNFSTGQHASNINIATSVKAGMANMKTMMFVGNGGAELTSAGTFTVNNGGCTLAFADMKVSRTIAVSGTGTYYVYGYEGSTFQGLTATAPAILNVILEPGCSYTGTPSLNGGTLTFSSPHPANLSSNGIQVWQDIVTASTATDASTRFRTLTTPATPNQAVDTTRTLSRAVQISTDATNDLVSGTPSHTQIAVITGFLQDNIVARSTDNHIQTNYVEDQGGSAGVTIDDSAGTGKGTLIKAGGIDTYVGLTADTGNIIATAGNIHTVAASTAGDIYAMLGNIYATGGNIYATAGNVHTVAATPNGDIYATAGNLYATGGNIYATAGNIHTVAASPNGDIYATAGNIYATAGNIHTIGAAGNIYASLGNIYATAGNIYATAGYVAAGTYVSAGSYITAVLGDITATNGNINANTLTNAFQINGTDMLHHGAGGYASNLFAGDGGNSINNTSALNDTALGMGALAGVASGAGNIAVGRHAGSNLTTQSNCFFLGNVQQGSYVNDTTYSLLYGTLSGTAGSVSGQQLTVNGEFTATGIAHLGGGLDLSRTIGDILYAPTANTTSGLADVAVGNVLLSGGVGVAPGYGKVGLTTHVSGVLPVANGGTNQTSFTGTKLPYFNGTSLTDSYLAQSTAGTGLIFSSAPSGIWGSYLGITDASDPAHIFDASPDGTNTVYLTNSNLSARTDGPIILEVPTGTAAGTYVLQLAPTGGGLVAYNTPATSSHAGNYIPRTNTTIANIEVTGVTIDDSNNISTAGSVTATAGNIAASAGAVTAGTYASAGTYLYAGSYITAASGAITATNGNINANTVTNAFQIAGADVLHKGASGYASNLFAGNGGNAISDPAAIYNSSIGVGALYSLTSGTQNTAVGYDALYFNTTGSTNTATGYAALYTNINGIANTAVGHGALYTVQSSNYGTALGYEALELATGGFNTAVGGQAGLSVTTGYNNVLLGYVSDVASGNVHDATALGAGAVAGTYNTAVGSGAVADGLYSVALGAAATTHGAYGTALGETATASANYSTAVGHSSTASGTDSTALGDAATASGNAGSIAIGYGASATIDGSIVLGSTLQSTLYCLAAATTPVTGDTLKIDTGTGQIGFTTSSRVYKTNISYDMDADWIYALKPVTFDRIGQTPLPGHEYGFIAEDVAESAPSVCVGLKNGKPNSVRSDYMISPLVKVVQDQKREIDSLNARLSALESKLNKQ